MLKMNISKSEFSLDVLSVTFQGQNEIEIDLSDFFKDQTYIHNLYTVVNDYIATLPQHSQQEIFDEFYKVYNNDYKQNFNDINYIVKLENKIAKVSELLNYNNFKLWLSHRENEILMPENIISEYIYDPDMNTTEEKTYVKREYRDLVALIIFIRMLSPLYIDYYSYIKQVTPHYYLKIFMLFIRSEVYVSPEIEKLKRYIEVNQETLVGTGKNEHLIITAGLSDDEILDSLVSEIIFNKLITIDFFNKKCNIVSFIFQTIRFKGSFSTPDSMNIRSKTPITDATKEDISYYEDYRKNSEIAIGTAAEIQHALDDIHKQAEILGFKDFDYDAYAKELENIGVFMEHRLDKVQMFMLGWFLDRIINPRALYYIEYRKVIELLLFAKIALLQRGHHFIAMLLSSYRSDSNYVNVIIRNTLNKTLSKKLEAHYKFMIEEGKVSNIEQTITEVSREITNNLWVPIGTESQLNNIINKEGYLDIPNNINDVVCAYIDLIHDY